MRANTHAQVELRLIGGACTDMALAFQDPENYCNDPIWIPKSKIANLEDVYDSLPDQIGWSTDEVVCIHIPIWLVEDKGLDSIAEEIDK
jgi:hypothetical protein